MKRRYQLLLIIIIGSIITFSIYFHSHKTKLNLVAIGDGVSLGMTAYNVVGISFNDYLSEYLENKNNLEAYNKEFCFSHLDIEKLNYMLEKNAYSNITHKPIKQIIEQADILTLAIGVDEFADLSLRNVDYDKYIGDFINNYQSVLNEIRTFYDKELVIIGIYPAYNLNKNTAIEINKKIQKLTLTYNAKYLDLLPISLNKKYYLQSTSYYMSYQAHQKIFEDILHLLRI